MVGDIFPGILGTCRGHARGLITDAVRQSKILHYSHERPKLPCNKSMNEFSSYCKLRKETNKKYRLRATLLIGTAYDVQVVKIERESHAIKIACYEQQHFDFLLSSSEDSRNTRVYDRKKYLLLFGPYA